MESKIYKGGIPTEMDVDKLLDKFGIPEEETIILFSEMETCIGQTKNTYRFKTVVYRWRQILRHQNNVIFGPIRGQGIKVLDPNKRIDLGIDNVVGGAKRIQNANDIISKTDYTRLSEPHKKKVTFCQNVHSSLKLSMLNQAKKITYEIPELKSIWGK